MSDLSTATQLIQRHRTALVRHDLSQPVALLVRHGLIGPGSQVFDYGCGQGDDVRILAASGISAAGWDPHFRPEDRRFAAPVVNLGFVLNVIEDQTERREALAAAWALTERVLAVATMIMGQVPVGGLRPHGDGYVTTRGTFQKYFQHAELRGLIAQTLTVNPVAVAPGIFFIFRAPEDEQEFLLNRRSGRRASTTAYRIARETRTRPARTALPERIALAVNEIAAFLRQRGRAPQADELTADVQSELTNHKVSLARAVQVCLETALTEGELEAAAVARREDLLVHYALGLLNKSTSANRPSAGMVRDIRAHIGTQKELSIKATDYLYGLADEARVRDAIQAAVHSATGVIDHRGRLLVDGDRADDLPGLLRCYFGCATYLAGEPEGPFILRIDPLRRRVAMWPLVDSKEVLPRTELSIRVDLRRQDISVKPDPRRLLRKGELLGLSTRSKQRRAEARYRVEKALPENAVFEHLDQALAARPSR